MVPGGPYHRGPMPLPSEPESALPPLAARVAAFVSIFVGAAAGGLIGNAFAGMGSMGSLATGIVVLISILIGAGGVAVVAVLTLRALGEWETIRERQEAEGEPIRRTR